MARHKSFTVATNVKVYFCDPHSPWQRGTNENTNRLLRQYLPKRTDLSGYTQSQLDEIALRLNQRPRKTLGFQTPRVNFAQVLRRPVEPAAEPDKLGSTNQEVTVGHLNRGTVSSFWLKSRECSVVSQFRFSSRLLF